MTELRLLGPLEFDAVTLPGGTWTDVLTSGRVDGGEASVTALLRRFPVAVLAKDGLAREA